MGHSSIKLSIITCTYNSWEFLEESIKGTIVALKNSNLKKNEYEWLIIDSSEETRCIQILEKYSNHFFIHKRIPAKGIYDALDFGICKSNGKYIAYIHSDDFIDKDFFLKSSLLNEHCDENISCEYGQVNFIKNNQVIFHRKPPYYVKFLQQKTNLIFHPNAIYLRKFELQNPYNNRINHLDSDWIHLQKFTRRNVIRNKDMVYNFRISPISSTVRNNKGNNFWNVYLLLFESKILVRLINRIFRNTGVWDA